MKKSIGFFTGARSEYGIMKNLINNIHNTSDLDYKLYVSGMHLLESFGNTIEEIRADGFVITEILDAFLENKEPGCKEFIFIINQLTSILKKNSPDVMFIIGDRMESYAAALACHFCSVPIIHSGGGTITRGAVDNIYRYNISNLSTYHFATSKGNYKRLLNLPTIHKENTFFTGSFAVDAIYNFRQNAISIKEIITELDVNNFCLMTFHSVTNKKELIAEVMDKVISYILSKGCQILITYPNNDPGYLDVIGVIEKWSCKKNVFITNHLGANGYYAALNDCQFVIGNSSSGIIEAPYFNCPVINVGSRQEGREADVGVISVPSDPEILESVLDQKFKQGWEKVVCHEIYGSGQTLEKINDILTKKIL